MISGDDIEPLDVGVGEVLVTSRLCEKVLELCRHHLYLSPPHEAAQHYQQVCRALVAETRGVQLHRLVSSKDLEEVEVLDKQECADILNEVC